jgi:hypothetical protein
MMASAAARPRPDAPPVVRNVLPSIRIVQISVSGAPPSRQRSQDISP